VAVVSEVNLGALVPKNVEGRPQCCGLPYSVVRGPVSADLKSLADQRLVQANKHRQGRTAAAS